MATFYEFINKKWKKGLIRLEQTYRMTLIIPVKSECPYNHYVREEMKIEYLADHKDVIHTIAQWFCMEWAYLHPNQTLNDVEKRIGERVNTNKIPLTLVAFDEEGLVGTVCLKINDMDTHLELKPWLAGLYVSEQKRRQGVGTELVSAIEKRARDLGVSWLYLYTPKSESFYARLGWQVKQRENYHEVLVSVMQRKLISTHMSS